MKVHGVLIRGRDVKCPECSAQLRDVSPLYVLSGETEDVSIPMSPRTLVQAHCESGHRLKLTCLTSPEETSVEVVLG